MQQDPTFPHLTASMNENTYTTEDTRQLPTARAQNTPENLPNEEAAACYTPKFPHVPTGTEGPTSTGLVSPNFSKHQKLQPTEPDFKSTRATLIIPDYE